MSGDADGAGVAPGCIQMRMAGLRSAVFAGRQSMRCMAPSGKGGSPMRTQHNWLVAGGLVLALATTATATAPAGRLLPAATRRSG